MNDRNPTAVITGASTGIGRATALHLDRLGWRVFAGVRRNEDGAALKALASERLTPIMLDVTDRDLVKAAAALVDKAVGDAGLAGLVNNAGIAVAGPLEFLPLDLLEEQLKVNVVGQVAVTQAFLPLLRRGRGRIVNISSDNGKAAWPYLGAYCASKHAIEALADSLRMELRPWGLKVILIEPGSIKTEIFGKSKTMADQLLEGLPPQGHKLYGPVIKTLYKVTQLMEDTAIEPDAVARAVAKALTAARPKARYVVGIDARFQIFAARVLPTSWRDALIQWLIARLGKEKTKP
jgi:NAD(P)-dependent dehydrogenase (short-subunit alcohol dehydrogenase family)